MSTKQSSPSAKQVHERERQQHIRKRPDQPLAGLALSGGGIRSATFGLGVLQALASIGFFERLDYVSTVSGGGYVGGWLQAALANGRRSLDALSMETEPQQVRFLRAYSNYLTPRLGLFSGDTWAAVGNTVRNLILNFSILSLSLIAPLYLPWLTAIAFWQLVPVMPLWNWMPAVGVLVVAGALFLLVVAESAANMAVPLAGGGWTSSGVSPSTPKVIFGTVIVPGLVATWLTGAVMWSLAQQHLLDTGAARALAALVGALSYGLVWACGLRVGIELRNRRSGPDRTEAVDYRRAIKAGGVVVLAGFAAGALGIALMALMMDALATAFEGETGSWLVALLSFPLGVVCLLVAVAAHLGLAGDHMSNETREWWARVGGIQLLIAVLLTILGVLSLAGPHGFELLPDWNWLEQHADAVKTTLGVAWAVLTGAGVAAGRSKRTATGGGNRLFEFIGKIAPAVFVVGYVLILATFVHGGNFHPRPGATVGAPLAWFNLGDVERMLRGLSETTDGAGAPRCSYSASEVCPGPALSSLALVMLVAGGMAWFISWRVDLNEFSLHTMYRNRLVRCFLGASRKRHPHPFTGFDSDDDLPLELSQLPPVAPSIRPYPIFNAAINLVGGKNLAWQTRKAASFVFTPEYCGFEYRDDEPREGGVEQVPISAYARTVEHMGDPRSLTLGLAVATSGAAASPNMGYHTSPTLSFLMTVFNVRLGWWLRNPRKPEVWTDAGRRLSLRELLYELGGITTDDKEWVYLSDGGHFENLGIYELVRRRCRFIIACDAGQDGDVTFEDLGNAIEKCRTDFGINIEIDLAALRPVERRSERHCAVGTIRYDRLSEQDADGGPLPIGTLLYIKCSLTGDEPADVLRYAAEHPAFPHEATSDQFFDESQFESYRALGFHAARDVFRSAVGSDRCGDLEVVEVFTLIRQRWGVAAPSPPDAVRKYSGALERIWSTVRSRSELKFLDSQMFPEMPALMALDYPRGGRQTPAPDVNYWLPGSEDHRREGFYVCIQMLQLMEDVFIEFQLDEYWDHIDNRGWLNLFQHWAWSGMLCATWAITGSTFDPRFQRFCRTRLDLLPGRPSVAIDGNGVIELPDPGPWRAWGEARKKREVPTPPELDTHMKHWQSVGGLNFWEAELVAKYLRATERATQTLFPVQLTVESPRRSDGQPLCFNVGYVIGGLDRKNGELVVQYMRIQNHLRKAGLARDALMALGKKAGLTIEVADPAFNVTMLEQNASDEALPTEDAVRRLRAIIRSLP